MLKTQLQHHSASLLLGVLALYMPMSSTAETPEAALQITPEGRVGIGTDTPGGLLGLKEKDVHLDVDENNNLTFTDANNSAVSLSELNDNAWTEDPDGNIYYTGGSVGIGTDSPALDAKLDVAGNIQTQSIRFPDGTQQTTAADIFPAGAIIFMIVSQCPVGWNPVLQTYTGRFIAITPLNGTTGWYNPGQLSDKTPPKHTHSIDTAKTFKNDKSSGSRTASDASTTGENSQDLPYLQLYACQKQ